MHASRRTLLVFAAVATTCPQRFGLHMEDVAEGILHSPSREMVIDGIATTLLWRVALTCTAHDCVKRYAIIKQRRQGPKEAGVVVQ